MSDKHTGYYCLTCNNSIDPRSKESLCKQCRADLALGRFLRGMKPGDGFCRQTLDGRFSFMDVQKDLWGLGDTPEAAIEAAGGLKG